MKALGIKIRSLFPDYRKRLMMEINSVIGEHYKDLRMGAIRLKNGDVSVQSLNPDDLEVGEFDLELLGDRVPEDYDPEYDERIPTNRDETRRVVCSISEFGMGTTLEWTKGSERWPNVQEIKTVVGFINALFEAAAAPLKEEIRLYIVRPKGGIPKGAEELGGE